MDRVGKSHLPLLVAQPACCVSSKFPYAGLCIEQRILPCRILRLRRAASATCFLSAAGIDSLSECNELSEQAHTVLPSTFHSGRC